MKDVRTLWSIGNKERKGCIMERIRCWEIKAFHCPLYILNWGFVHKVCIQSCIPPLELNKVSFLILK